MQGRSVTLHLDYKLLLFVILCFVGCQGAMKGNKYSVGDLVPVFTNTIGPYSNPSVTFEFYSLPFCKPTEEQLKKSKTTIGMALEGDRLFNSLYEHRFAIPVSYTTLCKKTLSNEEILKFRKAISRAYFYELIVDALPVNGFVGAVGVQPDETKTERYYLFTHLHFDFGYNEDRVIYCNVTADTTPSNLLLLEESAAEQTVTFSYSSSWKHTESKFSDRHKLSKPKLEHDLEIHWLSILNSVGLVVLLTGFLGVIINRIVRKDINRYTKSSSLEEADDLDDIDDYGWKLVHGDVFRFPAGSIYLSAFCGVGVQLLVVCSSILALSAVGFIYPEQMGSLYSAGVLMIAFASVISGAVSGGFYKKMKGDHWAWNLILAASLLVFPVAFISAGGNLIAYFYHSTSALPFITGLQIFLIWILVAVPLTVFGGITGRRLAGPFDAPVRTKNAVREIPPIPFYRSGFVHCLIGGFLPFSAIYIEIHYLYASLWGHAAYGLYGILLLVFIILLVVTASVTVALTYFQLSIEDHRWWWRSFFSAGSTGLFVLLYSVYYYLELSQMSGLLQTVKYFCFVSIVSYFFFVMLGTVGLYSSLLFVRHIYSTLKID